MDPHGTTCGMMRRPCPRRARAEALPDPGAGSSGPAQKHLIRAASSAICPGLVPNPSEAVQCRPLEVAVGDKGIERAIKHLKRKMAAEGILRELKRRRHHMKPSIKRRKKMSEAARRRRKREKIIQF